MEKSDNNYTAAPTTAETTQTEFTVEDQETQTSTKTE